MGLIDRLRWVLTGKALNDPVLDRGGWMPIVRESYPGAWQQNVTVDVNLVLSNTPVFRCINLISSDIAKLRVKLVEDDGTGIWKETKNAAYSPVLRKPNHFQNRIQFWENWILSKLLRGNAYVLKQRDGRGVVVKLYVLDPNRVRPLISDDGSIFYELNTDNITAITKQVIVPAREIIHDRYNCMFHPLVGVSPLFSANLPATQALNIQTNSAFFFGNQSQPGGILVAPGRIDPAHAQTLKTYWDENFTGANRGKIAVLGDGLKFESLAVTAEASQLIDQLKYSAESVCAAFGVPPYKVGFAQMPTYNNIQALNVEYYSQCLQRLIEDAELCLDEGLGMAENIGTDFDLDGLLRMDSMTQMQVLDMGKNTFTPNEARRRVNLGPKPGGDSVYRQQQEFSLEALMKRDQQEDPFGTAKPDPAPAQAPANDNDAEAEREAARVLAALYKGFR